MQKVRLNLQEIGQRLPSSANLDKIIFKKPLVSGHISQSKNRRFSSVFHFLAQDESSEAPALPWYSAGTGCG